MEMNNGDIYGTPDDVPLLIYFASDVYFIK